MFDFFHSRDSGPIHTINFDAVTVIFWYDTDFSEFDSADIIDYILEKSLSYQKKDGHGNDKDLKVFFLVMRVKCPSVIFIRSFNKKETTHVLPMCYGAKDTMMLMYTL